MSDSWGWRNILKLRQEAMKYIVIQIGDGRKASMWFDNWSSIGPLNSILTYRDLYDARLSSNLKVTDLIDQGVWKWPNEWQEQFPMIVQIQNITLDNQKNDQAVWKSKSDKVGKFTVQKAYFDFQEEENEVSWWKLVWFSQNIPKHSFVLWMEILNKLTTQDKVRSWGSYDLMACPLCYKDMDSHSHLFFKCSYTSQFWEKVLNKIGVQCSNGDWNGIVEEFASLPNGNFIGSIIRRLCLAASVYLIWQERNWRIFRGECRSWEELYNVFCETVRLRLLSLKMKPSEAVFKAQKVWNVSFNIVANGTVTGRA